MINLEDVEKVLKKYNIRTKTIFTRKSRLLEDVLNDVSKKWDIMSEDDEKIILSLLSGASFEKNLREKIEE